MPIGGLEESKVPRRIEPHHSPDRLALVLLDMSLQLARMILQPSPRSLEPFIDGKCQIGRALVGRRCALDIDFTFIWKGYLYIDLVEATGAVMTARRLDDNATGGNAAVALLKLGYVLLDRALQLGRTCHALEVDFDERLHVFLHFAPRMWKSIDTEGTVKRHDDNGFI